MTYKVFVSTTFDSYVEFKDKENLSDEEIKEKTDNVLQGNIEYNNSIDLIDVAYNVASGREYHIERE